MSYTQLASNLQSCLSRRAFLICKEDAFRAFYKEKGRVKEAKASKETLKELHMQQIQDKRVLRVLREMEQLDKMIDEGDQDQVVSYFTGAL